MKKEDLILTLISRLYVAQAAMRDLYIGHAELTDEEMEERIESMDSALEEIRDALLGEKKTAH